MCNSWVYGLICLLSIDILDSSDAMRWMLLIAIFFIESKQKSACRNLCKRSHDLPAFLLTPHDVEC
jgi:hypothetical protein